VSVNFPRTELSIAMFRAVIFRKTLVIMTREDRGRSCGNIYPELLSNIISTNREDNLEVGKGC
jgi:hypothetical protein